MLEIVTGPKTEILRQKAPLVASFDAKLAKLIADMAATMRPAKGIGIAAPQVNLSLELFLIDKEAFSAKESTFKFLKGPDIDYSNYIVVINPKLTLKDPVTTLAEEGCLSLPKKLGYVPRAKKVMLVGQTAKGETFKLQAKGLLARVIQHEFDHLQGTLICDKFLKPSA